MAIVVTTPVATLSTTTNAASYASASFQPTAGSLIVVMAFVSTQAGLTGTMSAWGGSFTRLTAVTANAAADSYYLFYYQVPATAPAAGAITFTPAGTAAGCSMQVYQITGHDSTLVPAFVTPTGTTANPVVNFGTATAASSAILIGVGYNRAAPTVTGPSGFTEISDTGYNTPTAGAATYRAVGPVLSSYTLTAAAGNWTAIGVVVKADLSSRGSLSVTLQGVTRATSGTVDNSGSADKTLANATLSAAGMSDQAPAPGTSKVRYVKVTSQSGNNHIVEIKALDNNSINQALNKSVVLGNPIGGDSSRLVNGDLARDAWTDLGGAGSNVTIDLNGLFDIASVNILYYYGGGWTYYSKIEVSPDGNTWYVAEDGTHAFVPVNADTTGRTVAVPTYSYSRPSPPANLMQARYVREYFAGQGYIVDLQVHDYFGNNLALGKTATYDSLVGASVGATVTDGVTGTAGFLGLVNRAVYVDLGSVQPIRSVRLHNYNDWSNWRFNVIVDVSIDGTTWTNLWDWNYDGATALQSGDVIPGKLTDVGYGRASATLAGVTTASSGTVTGPYVSPPTSKVRYIRDTLASGSGEIAWQEIQALDKFGVNKALGCPVTQVSGGQQQGSGISVVTDGGLGSYCWFYTPAALMIDLGLTQDISSIKRWHGTNGGVRNVNLLEVSPNGIDWYTVFDSNVSGTYPEYSSGREDSVPVYFWNPRGGVDVTLQGVTPWIEGVNANPVFPLNPAGTYSIERQYSPTVKPAFGVIDRGNPDAASITGYWTFEGHLYSLAAKRGDAGGVRADGFKFVTSDVGRGIQHGGSGTTSITTGLIASQLGIDGNKPKVIIAEFDMDTSVGNTDRNVFSIGYANGQQDFSCIPNGGWNIKFNFWGNDLNFSIPNNGVGGLYRVFAAFGHNGTNAYVHIWTRHAATGATQSGTYTGVFAATNTSDAVGLTFLQGGSNAGWGQYPLPLYRVIVFAGIDMSRAQFERIRGNPNKLIRAPYPVFSAGDGSNALPPRKGTLSKWLAGVTVDANAIISQPDNPPRIGELNAQLASVTVNATGTVPSDASTPHKIWRFSITALNGGNQQGISEIEMRATVGGADMCVGGIAAASAIYDGSFAASMAFDNNLNTRWSTNGIQVAWISYEFASPTPIAEYTVAPVDSGRGWKNFTLEFSDDNGATWKIADTRTNITSWVAQTPMTFTVPGAAPATPALNGSLVQTLQNVAVSASGTVGAAPATYAVRYIRDHINNSSKLNNHWVEVQAFDAGGANVALGKSATANQPVTSGSLTVITDGSIAINGASGYVDFNAPAGGVTMTVDLGQVYDITSTTIWHYYLDGRTYYEGKTEVSPDGVTWYTTYDYAVDGTYAETSSGFTRSAAYAVGRVGTVAATLQGVTGSAAGTIGTAGALASVLAGVSVSATGTAAAAPTSDGIYYRTLPWTTQPRVAVPLDRSQPLARGLKTFFHAGALFDLANGVRKWDTASQNRVFTSNGLGFYDSQIPSVKDRGLSVSFLDVTGIVGVPKSCSLMMRVEVPAAMNGGALMSGNDSFDNYVPEFKVVAAGPGDTAGGLSLNLFGRVFSASNVVTPGMHTFGFIVDMETSGANTMSLLVDGVVVASTIPSTITYSGTGMGNVVFMNSAANYAALMDYKLITVAAWNRPLRAYEADQFHRNPWSLLQKRRVPVFTSAAFAAPTGTLRRALIWFGGYVSQVTDALRGTGKKALVLVNGRRQERVASEGQPLVLVDGKVQTLPTGDTLDI